MRHRRSEFDTWECKPSRSAFTRIVPTCDAITKVPGSFRRSVQAIRFLRAEGLSVIVADVLMLQNIQDYPGVRALGAELGVEVTIDPTITPKMDGDRSLLELNIDQVALGRVFRDEALVGNVRESRRAASSGR